MKNFVLTFFLIGFIGRSYGHEYFLDLDPEKSYLLLEANGNETDGNLAFPVEYFDNKELKGNPILVFNHKGIYFKNKLRFKSEEPTWVNLETKRFRYYRYDTKYYGEFPFVEEARSLHQGFKHYDINQLKNLFHTNAVRFDKKIGDNLFSVKYKDRNLYYKVPKNVKYIVSNSSTASYEQFVRRHKNFKGLYSQVQGCLNAKDEECLKQFMILNKTYKRTKELESSILRTDLKSLELGESSCGPKYLDFSKTKDKDNLFKFLKKINPTSYYFKENLAETFFLIESSGFNNFLGIKDRFDFYKQCFQSNLDSSDKSFVKENGNVIQYSFKKNLSIMKPNYWKTNSSDKKSCEYDVSKSEVRFFCELEVQNGKIMVTPIFRPNAYTL